MSDSLTPNFGDDRSQQTPTWVKRVRLRYPQESAKHTDAELAELVRESLNTCDGLQIKDEAAILRYVALRVLITPQQRQSRLIRGTLIRTLSNLDWDSAQRLDFVYKYIVGRPVSSSEPDFGPSYVPPVKALNGSM